MNFLAAQAPEAIRNSPLFKQSIVSKIDFQKNERVERKSLPKFMNLLEKLLGFHYSNS
jgi:hypothetical protein